MSKEKRNKFISELALLCDKHNHDIIEMKTYDALKQLVLTIKIKTEEEE